jgi:Ku70/Ku80 beta-barrel domain
MQSGSGTCRGAMHEFGMRRAGRSAASPHAGMVASGAPDSTSEPVARMLLPKVQAEYPVMPASRPYWKGYLKLSLVSCPIALYTASASSERVSFRQVNKKTGNRLRQQLVDDVTRESVEAADKGRGYEVAKNTFILIDDEELDAVAIESTHTIEIDSFVPRAQIDERYFESPYYIVPNDQVGQEAFAVIREAMRDKGMVALGAWSSRNASASSCSSPGTAG